VLNGDTGEYGSKPVPKEIQVTRELQEATGAKEIQVIRELQVQPGAKRR